MNEENSFSGHHSAGRTVLVTHSNSVVGQAVLNRLIEGEPVGRLAAVTFAGGDRPHPPGVRIVHGALTVPRLGLLPRAYDDLALGVDAVVYTGQLPCGRQIDTALGREIGEVLSFADHAHAPLYFVGSAFAQRRVGRAAETLTSVADWADVLNAAGPQLITLRPSIVLGDSRTGAISSFPVTYRILGALLDGAIRAIAAHPGTLLDFVPCDMVADVIVRLIAADVRSGHYWLTAGERALTIEQALDVLAQHAAEQQLDFRRPRLGGAVVPDPGFGHRSHRLQHDNRSGLSTLPDRWTRRFMCLEPLESSLGDRFATSISELGGLGVAPLPDARELLVTSLRYWARATDENRPERVLA